MKALLEAFGEANTLSSAPLAVRIVFSKLFEQHVLLKLEKIFLGTISIVANHRDEKFVDKLHITSSRFRTSIGTNNTPSAEQLKRHTLIVGRGAEKEQLVEAAADEFIAQLVSAFEMPKFVKRMIRTKWRRLIAVIGVNRGCASPEWEEATHTAEQLKIDARVDQLRNSGAGKTRLLDDSAQDAVNNEASISLAGESILDERALDGLATLSVGPSSEPKPDLNNLINEVNSLGERSAIKFLIDGRMRDCTLTLSKMDPEL